METPRFVFKTTMEKSDYRKFLYFATFIRNKLTLPAVVLIALAGSVVANQPTPLANPAALALTWLLMFCLAVAAAALRVEYANSRRVATDNTGSFDSLIILSFYDDRLVMQNLSVSGTGTLAYSRFYKLMETREYFIFYLNANQASLLRKKDIPDPQRFGEFIRQRFLGRYNNYSRLF